MSVTVKLFVRLLCVWLPVFTPVTTPSIVLFPGQEGKNMVAEINEIKQIITCERSDYFT